MALPSILKPDLAEAAASEAARPVVRKARLSDVKLLAQLINSYASMGVMLPRTEAELAESIRDFMVAELDGRLVGCGALHFYTPTTGEVRSLAIDPQLKGHGIGRRLMLAIEAEAESYGLHFMFAFTYVPGFFEKLGFVGLEREALPSKVWKDCLRCPKFQCCDEIAMRKVLRTPTGVNGSTLICGDTGTAEISDETGISFPVVRKVAG